MVFSIKPHKGRWLVLQDGVRVFSAGQEHLFRAGYGVLRKHCSAKSARDG